MPGLRVGAMRLAVFLAIAVFWALPARAGQTSKTETTSERFDSKRLEQIDQRGIANAIAAGQAPGAVVAVGDSRGIAFRKAFGNRALEPTASR